MKTERFVATGFVLFDEVELLQERLSVLLLRLLNSGPATEGSGIKSRVRDQKLYSHTFPFQRFSIGLIDFRVRVVARLQILFVVHA